MPFYEHVFIARQDLSPTQVDALAQDAAAIVSSHKGRVHKTENWGLRPLAYKIAKNSRGHYVMLAIESQGDAVSELERQAAINEDIIRWLTIRTEEIEKKPSIMMRKPDRERHYGDERGRDDRPRYSRPPPPTNRSDPPDRSAPFSNRGQPSHDGQDAQVQSRGDLNHAIPSDGYVNRTSPNKHSEADSKETN